MIWRSFLPLLVVLTAYMPLHALPPPPRLLYNYWHTEHLRSSVLPANSGWHDVYQQSVSARASDVLVIDSSIQLSVDTVSQVGQQFRLLVNGQPVGYKAIEINVNPGSHHLPIRSTALYQVPQDGVYEVSAQASAFHSDGNFQVTIDHADNLSYGTLIVEQYRESGDLSGWSLRQLYHSSPNSDLVYGKEPYRQLAIAELSIAGGPRDLLRLTGQTTGQAVQGLEMVAGVMTAQDLAISPYGGENVSADNVFAPLQLDAVYPLLDALPKLLQLRVYGGFKQGFKLYPEATHLEVLHFSQQKGGLELRDWGQLTNPDLSSMPSNAGLQDLLSREFYMEKGEILRVRGNVQFARPEVDLPVTVECQMRLCLSGGGERKFLKNLTPTRAAVPLSGSMLFQAPSSGRYRLSLQASGFTDVGAVRLRLDADQTQLQYLRYTMIK